MGNRKFAWSAFQTRLSCFCGVKRAQFEHLCLSVPNLGIFRGSRSGFGSRDSESSSNFSIHTGQFWSLFHTKEHCFSGIHLCWPQRSEHSDKVPKPHGNCKDGWTSTVGSCYLLAHPYKLMKCFTQQSNSTRKQMYLRLESHLALFWLIPMPDAARHLNRQKLQMR